MADHGKGLDGLYQGVDSKKILDWFMKCQSLHDFSLDSRTDSLKEFRSAVRGYRPFCSQNLVNGKFHCFSIMLVTFKNDLYTGYRK